MLTFYSYYVTKQQDFKFLLYAKHSQMFWCVYQHELSMLCSTKIEALRMKISNCFSRSSSLFLLLHSSIVVDKDLPLWCLETAEKREKNNTNRKVTRKGGKKLWTKKQRQTHTQAVFQSPNPTKLNHVPKEWKWKESAITVERYTPTGHLKRY